MTNLYTYPDVEQRSDEWHELRRGLVTASSIGSLLTPTLEVAHNEKSRSLLALLVSERITGRTEDTYQSLDMLRGVLDEPLARALYTQHTGHQVTDCGFMIRDDNGHRIGFSPDGLVGDDGLIEIKSRLPKHQLMEIVDGRIPAEHMAQVQTGLYVSGRAWCDYISYCGGLPIWVVRALPAPEWFDAIATALDAFEVAAQGITNLYRQRVEGLPVAERTDHFADIKVA